VLGSGAPIVSSAGLERLEFVARTSLLLLTDSLPTLYTS
jgi:hypothetical protein